MSIFGNTTARVNQETPLKLQSILKQKHVAMLAKKTCNDLRIRRSISVLYKKKYRGTSTHYQVQMVPVKVIKKYRGTLVHGNAHH